jgi:hypothetical protein
MSEQLVIKRELDLPIFLVDLIALQFIRRHPPQAVAKSAPGLTPWR